MILVDLYQLIKTELCNKISIEYFGLKENGLFLNLHR